jgi:hypothetical protein
MGHLLPNILQAQNSTIERAERFMSSFASVQLSRAFSCFKNLKRLLLPIEEKQVETPEPMKPILDTLTCLIIFACKIGGAHIQHLGYADNSIFGPMLGLHVMSIPYSRMLGKGKYSVI